ncbi:MAG: hypothetical protein ACREGF_07295, partial [Candidatus Saccharimonadales bacterium]
MSTNSAKRRLTRQALLVFYVVILAAILTFVLQKPHNTVTAAPTNIDASAVATSPLDQLASADIALTVARMDNMPEQAAIANQADSQQAELSIAATTNNVVTKPQIVTTALKSRDDIETYTTPST